MGILTKLGTGQGYLKAGFLGFQASGKTFSASVLAIGLRKYAKLDGPIAMFDTEGGSEYIADRVKKETGKDLLGVKSQSFQDLLDMAEECLKANVSVLIVDSVTHVWRELCDSYLDQVNAMLAKRNLPSRKKLEFQDWNPIKRKWADWAMFYLNAPLHIIICGRAGFIYEMEMNEETKRKELVTTGVKMKTESEFGFEPSLLIEMERVQVPQREGGFKMLHHAIVVKDRFSVMDGAEMDDPGFDFFLPHIALLTPGANAKIDVTSRTPMQVDEAGADDFQRRKLRQQKAWEEVENGLTMIYPGAVGKDKQVKLTILSELTGSASELKIQQLPPDQLETIALAIRQFGQDILAGLTIEKPAAYVRTLYDKIKESESVASSSGERLPMGEEVGEPHTKDALRNQSTEGQGNVKYDARTQQPTKLQDYINRAKLSESVRECSLVSNEAEADADLSVPDLKAVRVVIAQRMKELGGKK